MKNDLKKNEKWKMTSKKMKMEDDLNYFFEKLERRPQTNGRQPQKKMEDNLKKMENDLKNIKNRRRS